MNALLDDFLAYTLAGTRPSSARAQGTSASGVRYAGLDEGVLLLMSDSTNTPYPGRTPTESTLQQSFYDIIGQAEGRVFVAIFSSNMNRVQMIVNAAAAAGRRVDRKSVV